MQKQKTKCIKSCPHIKKPIVHIAFLFWSNSQTFLYTNEFVCVYPYIWHTLTNIRYTLPNLPDSSGPQPLPTHIIKTNHLLDFYKENDLLLTPEASEEWETEQEGSSPEVNSPLRFPYASSQSFGADIDVDPALFLFCLPVCVSTLWRSGDKSGPPSKLGLCQM